MAFEEIFIDESLKSAFTGGIMGALVALGIITLVLVLIGFYIYFAMAWQTIAKKLRFKKSWLAWVPIANWAMILHLGGFHWAWIFLILVPVLGWIALFVLCVIAHWRIFEARKYPGWFSLSIIIPQVGFILYLIAIGFVAWGDKTKIHGEAKRRTRTKSGKKKARR